MIKVHLDFESRSKADIWSCGAYKYSQDPSTEVLCIAYCVDDGPVQIVGRNAILYHMQGLKGLERWALDPNAIFIAHNAFFEQCIWKNIMVKRHGFPEIPISRWRCTAAKAQAHGLPKALANVALELKLSQQKDEEGKRTMMKLSKPRKATKNDASEWHENEEDFQKLYEYCMQDVEVERAIDRALPDLTPTEQKVWILDQAMNMNGIRVDLELVDAAINLANEYSAILNQELYKLTGGMVDKHTKRGLLLNWVQSQGIDLPDTQANTVRRVLKEQNLPSDVRRVLEIKNALAKSSVSKYEAFKDSTCDDGRLRDILVYHSASTGRWGGKIVQLQNLPRGNEKYTDAAAECIKKLPLQQLQKLYPDIMGILSSCIRSVLLPDTNKALFVADYSSIEARVVAWLADQNDVLNTFRNGGCVYCKEASGIFGRKITKADKFERQIGKVAVLALGYQGGIGAFGTMANAYSIDLEPVYDIVYPTITEQEFETAQWMYDFYKSRAENPLSEKGGIVADLIKQRWRRNNPKIVEMWSNVEQAAINAVKYNLTSDNYTKAAKCHFFIKGDFLYCQLPSGRKLAYHHPRIEATSGKEQLTYMTLLSQTKKYVRTMSYGGKLVENITQAVARDIMANGLLKIQDSKQFIPHLTVHDEAIASGHMDLDVKLLEKCLCELPQWANGLPIDAEGWKGLRYKK